MIWIDEHDVLVLHGRLLADHGGATGLRDSGLLSSALARPKRHVAYGTEDVIELAAIYTAGLIQNHAFVDGNKRIGFLIGILFAELNGYRFTASQEQATTAVLALAAGEWKEAEYIGFLLVYAMAGLPPPPLGTSTLPAGLTSVQAASAANWH